MAARGGDANNHLDIKDKLRHSKLQRERQDEHKR
jgi:hypothetical protein